MQKKLTVLFAFAFFVLIVGLHTDSYAEHKKNPNAGHGGGGGGGPQFATVDLDGGMRTMGFPVTVQTDSSKKTEVDNFNLTPGITTNFGSIDPDTCVVFRGDVIAGDALFLAIIAELDDREIESDSFFVRVDHTKDTGFFTIQYTDTSVQNLGSMRIQFRNAFVDPLESQEGNTRTWNLSGTVRVWQRKDRTNADDNIIECTARNASPYSVDFILKTGEEKGTG